MNPNRVALAAKRRRAGSYALRWVGWIAGLLLTLAVAPPYLGSQEDGSYPDKGASDLTARVPNNPVQTVDADALKLLEPLESLIQQSQYQQATQGLELYLHDHDSSARGHYDLGYVFFRTHQVGGAVRELSRSLQLNDKDAQAHKILGLVCTFVGRYDLAETELQAAAQLEPDSSEIHYFLGRIYYTRQVFPMALKEFQTAIQLNPAYMKAYGNLGLVMEVLGKDDEAVRDYTTAAQINEARHLKSPWPFEFLSAHYNRTREPALAIEYAQKALQIDPKCDLAYYDLAKAFESQGDWQKAMDGVQKAIAINSSTPEYFYLLSTALRKLGKVPESEAALKRFEQIHDDQNAMAKEWRDASHQPNLPKTPIQPDDEH
ncbi:MAG TPA: tetratricopeptide repeat protein [Terriglobia bacterium]